MTNLRQSFVLRSAIAAVSVVAWTSSVAATGFSYSSSPGSWVGGGLTLDIKPEQLWDFQALGMSIDGGNPDNSVVVNIRDVVNFPVPVTEWSLSFAAPR